MQYEITCASFFLKLSLVFVDMTIPTMRIFLATLQSPSGTRDSECLLLLQSFCTLYSRVAESLMRHHRLVHDFDWSNSFIEHLLSDWEHSADMLRFVFSLVPRKAFLSAIAPAPAQATPPSTQSAQSGSVPVSVSVSLPTPCPAPGGIAVAVVPSTVPVPAPMPAPVPVAITVAVAVPSPTSAWLPGPGVPSESPQVIEANERLLAHIDGLVEHTRKGLLPVDPAAVDNITADAAVQPALEALFLVYPALCVHLWHFVCRSFRTLDEKQLRTIGSSLSTSRDCVGLMVLV